LQAVLLTAVLRQYQKTVSIKTQQQQQQQRAPKDDAEKYQTRFEFFKTN